MTHSAGAVDLAALADSIDRRLSEQGDQTRAAAERRYLKSSLVHYGVRVPDTRRTVRAALAEHTPLDRAEAIELVLLLWDGVFERRRAALEVLVGHAGQLEPEDLPLVADLARQARTWALVDELAISVAGTVLASRPDDPQVRATLRRWSQDEDFWVRRCALLAPLRVLRSLPREPAPLTPTQAAVLSEWDRCSEAMVDEKEFFIRKAIGWVLREVSKGRPDYVREWLERFGDRASGVTRREAVKYLPAS